YRGETFRDVLQTNHGRSLLFGLLSTGTEFDLRHYRRGKVFKNRDVIVSPLVWPGINRTQAAERESFRGDERDTGICHDPDFGDRQIIPESRVITCIIEDQW